jgi:hypothetical protein
MVAVGHFKWLTPFSLRDNGLTEKGSESGLEKVFQKVFHRCPSAPRQPGYAGCAGSDLETLLTRLAPGNGLVVSVLTTAHQIRRHG